VTYRQDRVERTCAICGRQILLDEWIMDLFRTDHSPVEWVHESCARSSIEVFLTKKRSREAKQSV
jgi:hypothetical protein